MTPHASDSGSGDPRRRMRTAGGDTLEPAEPYVASQANRLLARLGVSVDGFLVWRAYALVRAVWRLRSSGLRRRR